MRCRLEYGGLKKRVANRGQAKRKRAAATPPTFLEFVAPEAKAVTNCTVEVESAQGGKLRLKLKAVPTTELVGVADLARFASAEYNSYLEAVNSRELIKSSRSSTRLSCCPSFQWPYGARRETAAREPNRHRGFPIGDSRCLAGRHAKVLFRSVRQ